MCKVKLTFEFGDGDSKEEVIEEFDSIGETKEYITEAKKLKALDSLDMSFDQFNQTLGNLDAAIYWFEAWPFHHLYGFAHITYIEVNNELV